MKTIVKIRNVFVDDEGRTYRVAFYGEHRDAKVLCVIGRDHTGHDTGPALAIEGRRGRQIAAAARKQLEASQ